jgi:hypothetical protein
MLKQNKPRVKKIIDVLMQNITLGGKEFKDLML